MQPFFRRMTHRTDVIHRLRPGSNASVCALDQERKSSQAVAVDDLMFGRLHSPLR